MKKRFVRPVKRVLSSRIDIILASFAINILTLGLPIVILQVYDRIIPGESEDTFLFMVIGLIGVVILDAMLRSFRTNIMTWEATRYEHGASQRALHYLLNGQIHEFEKTAPGVHMDRFNSIDPLREHQSGQGFIAFTELPFAILFLVLIWLINDVLVIGPLLICLVAFLFAVWLGINLDRLIRMRNDLDDIRYNFIFQVLNGIHSVKALGMEAQIHRQFQKKHAPLASVIQKLTFYSVLGQSLGQVFSSVAMISVAAVGSVLVIEGNLTGGSLMACTLLSGRAVQPLIRMISVWVQFRGIKIAEENLNHIANTPQEETTLNKKPTELKVQGHIEMEDVTIHMGRPQNPILRNMNFDIQPGQIVAIGGEAGHGRSILLEAIAGFVKIDEGTMRFDGIDSKNVDFKELRKQIGFIRQHATLYRGTIADNLTVFRGRNKLAPALEIANELGLTEKIATMPQGLMTPVGDTASDNLSGSVQQMMGLTLTLADKPKILLLDEANSDLDSEADQNLREYLNSLRGKATILMITERPSLIRIADRLLDIKGGEVTIKDQIPNQPWKPPAAPKNAEATS